jgi:hypothetical protein
MALMGHIAIKLNPSDLSNPDADIRYEIPDLVANETGNRVRDNGYDYADGNIMIIYLECDDPVSDVRDVIAALESNEVCDNKILNAAVIGISTDAKTFSVMHPANYGGEFTITPS